MANQHHADSARRTGRMLRRAWRGGAVRGGSRWTRGPSGEEEAIAKACCPEQQEEGSLWGHGPANSRRAAPPPQMRGVPCCHRLQRGPTTHARPPVGLLPAPWASTVAPRSVPHAGAAASRSRCSSRASAAQQSLAGAGAGEEEDELIEEEEEDGDDDALPRQHPSVVQVCLPSMPSLIPIRSRRSARQSVRGAGATHRPLKVVCLRLLRRSSR